MPSSRTYSEAPISFRSSQAQILGVMTLPRTETPHKSPCVVLAHGFTGEKTEHHRIFVTASRRLAEYGIASLRFDFRFSGDSEGDFEDTTISAQVADFKEAIRYLSSREEIDPTRVGALGLSMGSVVALESSVSNVGVKAVCLWAAMADPGHVFSEWMKKDWLRKMVGGERYAVHYGLPSDYIEPAWTLRSEFFDDLPRHNPLKQVAELGRPVLLVHGDKDQDVDVENSKRLFELAKEPKRLVIIQGAGHVFFGIHQTEKTLSETVRFFREHL